MARDWSRYWRSTHQPLEAMHAHFEQHVYHQHSHETYSFGVTEEGAQTFHCRGWVNTSAAGMVMALNPDDPHDGRAYDRSGFTYRMLHLGPDLVADVIADITGQRAALPLFADPVLDDPVLARRLRVLHQALVGRAAALRRDELLASAVAGLVRRATARPRLPAADTVPAGAEWVARRARQFIHDTYGQDVTAEDLAAAAGRSRFAVHRAFRSVYGVAPSDYQRMLRLRTARRLIAQGRPLSEAAAEAGFADQSHLTRWFSRCYGITPGSYQRASTDE
ncbi:MAG TPA: AraC family transcriptional regulator [Streptosporangiaceae bacterium]|nr:AraC family transcriptional regulator [Streptosporangiaceae bacterium]